MELEDEREFVSNDSLNSWVSRVFVFCLFLIRHIPIEIIMAKARQKQKIVTTMPHNEFSVSIVFVVVLIAVVELYAPPVTIKLELVSYLPPIALFSREDIWYGNRPFIWNSGIVLKKKIQKNKLILNCGDYLFHKSLKRVYNIHLKKFHKTTPKHQFLFKLTYNVKIFLNNWAKKSSILILSLSVIIIIFCTESLFKRTFILTTEGS